MRTWLERVKEESDDIDMLALSLLANGEEDFTIDNKDENNDTPLKIAIRKKLAGEAKVSQSGLDLIDILIDHGASLTKEVLEDLYPNDLDLLFRILQRGILEAACHKTESETMALVDMALDFDLDMPSLLNGMCFRDGRFPLHCAIEADYQQLTLALMAKGAACDISDRHYLAPLAFARAKNRDLFYKMLSALLYRHPASDAKWSSHENDYIFEEMIKILSPILNADYFSRLEDDVQWRHSIYQFLSQFPKKDLTRVVLKIGSNLSIEKAAALKADILQEEEAKRSMLAKLFWKPKFNACHPASGQLAEVAKKLVGVPRPSVVCCSIFRHEKKYANLDFKEFEIPKQKTGLTTKL